MSKPRSRRDSAAITPPGRSANAIERDAAEWLALREQRALTPDEQADYVAWLAADPRHRAAVEELDAAWRTFDRLADYPRPACAPEDPNFFARPRRFTRVLPTAFAATAAAAAAVIFVGWWQPEKSPPLMRPAAVAGHASATTRLVRFPDGSEAELKPGSEVQERFVPAERRVKLVRGEVHFTVAKDVARPFVVEANSVAVRAVGTAFNVRLEESAVEVLVTEGTVKVDPRPTPTPDAPPAETVLRIHQRTSIPTLDHSMRTPVVETLTIAEIDRALAWQTNRLIFDEMPLMDVVARFNRANPQRLVVQDLRLRALRISGRFRADNLDAFVELLESSFGVAAEHRADGEILLHKAP